jgi:hypothetical protein
MSKNNEIDWGSLVNGILIGVIISMFVISMVYVFSEPLVSIDKSVADELCTKLVGLPSEHYYDNNLETKFSCKIIEPEKPVQKINIPQVNK